MSADLTMRPPTTGPEVLPFRRERRKAEERPPLFGDPGRFGLWAFLGTVSMLFIGLTSAYIVRRGGTDWREIRPPTILWLNTALLLASSATLEQARRAARRRGSMRAWVLATGALGGLFLAGQLMAWRSLVAQGVFLASNPHSSFFYLLTGLHGVHLLGGLVWFAAISAHLSRAGGRGLALFATYWHFLAALWLYLLLLLFVL